MFSKICFSLRVIVVIIRPFLGFTDRNEFISKTSISTSNIFLIEMHHYIKISQKKVTTVWVLQA